MSTVPSAPMAATPPSRHVMTAKRYRIIAAAALVVGGGLWWWSLSDPYWEAPSWLGPLVGVVLVVLGLGALVQPRLVMVGLWVVAAAAPIVGYVAMPHNLAMPLTALVAVSLPAVGIAALLRASLHAETAGAVTRT